MRPRPRPSTGSSDDDSGAPSVAAERSWPRPGREPRVPRAPGCDGYRSPEHNRAVGGATRSKHLDGTAFDIGMANHDPAAFEAAAREVGFLGFGFYPRSGFIHVDLGPARQWGERFPARATAFAAETPPAREVLADSRTMKGGGAAGVATLGAAGVEVAQSALAETQIAILPLVPYLDTLRWVFIAVALGGIAVTIYARLDDWRRGRR
ncbi:YcbK family protein [Pannonibacter indicus]|uniref:YcbK family protein n=1 Tax=Pannonibacter indicus TaxID=466044 RepID=UPI0035AEEE3D